LLICRKNIISYIFSLYNFSVDCAVYVYKYIESIAFGNLSAVDVVTDTVIQKLRGKHAYMLLADKAKSWNEITEKIRRMIFED